MARTAQVDTIDPAWLAPDSGATVWGDVREPTPEDDAGSAAGSSGFTRSSMEDALQAIAQSQSRNVRLILYVVLHGIDFKQAEQRSKRPTSTSFSGATILVTVHDGGRRSIAEVSELCDQRTFRCARARSP